MAISPTSIADLFCIFIFSVLPSVLIVEVVVMVDGI